jgi:hypothetical protein
MNALLDKIKADAFEARKARNTIAANLLNTLASEVSAIPASRKLKEGEVTWPATEDETKDVLTKFVKNAKFTIENLEKNGRDATKEKAELDILMGYLPKQMDDTTLQTAIASLVQQMLDGGEAKSMKMMGKVMGELKTRYEGQFDNAKASQMVKAALA